MTNEKTTTETTPEPPDQHTLESDVGSWLFEQIEHQLPTDKYWRGIRWSPDMPTDEPYAEFLVQDERGQEYYLEIEVMLVPTSKEQRAKDNEAAQELVDKIIAHGIGASGITPEDLAG